jgi:bacterioferritin (cytochrome b1)
METGVVTTTYGRDVDKAIEILQSVLATEIIVVLRYTMHAITATGPSVEEEHATDMHDLLVAHEGRPSLES